VANKLDLYNQRTDDKEQQRNGTHAPRPLVAQRNVLGLHGVEYYGKNFRYEYQISTTLDNDTNNTNGSNSSQVSISNGSTTEDSLKIKKGTKRRMEISSYLVNRDNWTTDGSYLESLLQSEDGSHPDRDMVLLWCMRHRLRLVEISAATGEGVHEAVEALIVLALENLASASLDTSTLTQIQKDTRINAELDLHHRYSKKNSTGCYTLPSFRNCFCNR
jgi:hypothetical protein